MNRRAIISHLLNVPAVSRANLAKAVGVGPATAGKIVDELLHDEIVQQVEAETSGVPTVGRPGQLISLDTQNRRLIMVQLGVVHTRIAAVPLGFRGPDRWDVTFDTPSDARAWMSAIGKAIGSLRCSAPWAVIISAPGIVDEAASKILFSPNMHWLANFDFTAAFKNVLRCPILLVQEMRALALGHTTLTPGLRDFLLVDFSHGLGGAAIIGGELYRSPLPLSGELGHTPIAGNNRPCGCGAVGCVETLVSRRGLFASIYPNSRSEYDWAKVLKHIRAHGLEPWLKESLQAAASTIAGSINVLGLEHVVITGTMFDMPDDVRQFMAEAIKQGSLWQRFGNVSCDFSPRTRIPGLIKIAIDRVILQPAK